MADDPALDAIKAQLGTVVPFVGHVGISVDEVAPGRGAASLEQRPETSNHLGGQHAGALYTLGETASGAAMLSAFADIALTLRAVASTARIDYRKLAKGKVTAVARTDEPAEGLRARLDADGKAAFEVGVSLRTDDGTEVASMTVAWDVRRAR